MLGACEDGGVGDVRANAAAWAGAEERVSLGSWVRKEIVKQEVT